MPQQLLKLHLKQTRAQPMLVLVQLIYQQVLWQISPHRLILL